MSLGLIVLIIVVLMLLGFLPTWGHSWSASTPAASA
jgi:hypothetical protein